MRRIQGGARKGDVVIAVSDGSMMGCQLLANALRRARFEVTDCVVKSDDLVRAIQERPPDIAIVSAHLQDGRMHGVAAVRSIRELNPGVRCIVLLEEQDRDLVIAVFRAGAKAIFFRAEPFTTLCKCIRAVKKGQIWINSNDLESVLETLATDGPADGSPPDAAQRLTKREREIVALVREGLTNRQVAERLFVSEHTVKNHLFHVFEKLGVCNRVELLSMLTQDLNPSQNDAVA